MLKAVLDVRFRDGTHLFELAGLNLECLINEFLYNQLDYGLGGRNTAIFMALSLPLSFILAAVIGLWHLLCDQKEKIPRALCIAFSLPQALIPTVDILASVGAPTFLAALPLMIIAITIAAPSFFYHLLALAFSFSRLSGRYLRADICGIFVASLIILISMLLTWLDIEVGDLQVDLRKCIKL